MGRPLLIDPELLLTFVHVAEAASFAKAAESLGRTQSGVSIHIKRLETLLGYLLLTRSRGRRPEMTPQGQRLLTRARAILALNQAVRDDLSGPALSAPPLPEVEQSVMQAQRQAFSNQLMITLLTNEKFSAAYAEIMHQVETQQSIDPKRLDADEDDRYMALLSMLEYIAINYLTNTLDRSIIMRQRRSGLWMVYEKLTEYIRYKRLVWGRPYVYRSFETLALEHLSPSKTA